MHFGKWVQERRVERGIDVRTFAARTGVDVGTISRIENERTQVTLKTAVQICEGIGVPLSDLLKALLGKFFPSLEQQSPSETKVMPTIRDAEAFLAYAHQDQRACYSWLAHLLNGIAASGGLSTENKRKRGLRIFVPEDIQKLLLNHSLYRFELQYPDNLGAEQIWNIYKEGGLLTYTDVGSAIKHVRRKKHVTLARLEDSVKISASVLSNLESGSIERIRLIDVLTLDQQLAQEGKIIAMYWSACRSHQQLICLQQSDGGAGSGEAASLFEQEQDMKLIAIYTTICRWLEVVNEDTFSWIEQLRTQLRQLNPQC